MLAAVAIAIVAALVLDATTLYGFLATTLLVGSWVTFRLTARWPIWMRVIVLALTFFFPAIARAAVLIVRWRRARRQDRSEDLSVRT